MNEDRLDIEAPGGPTSSSADSILVQNKAEIVPDILADAGDVAVSNLEWVQNRSGDHWPPGRVANAWSSG
jgi:glutamate dehydrogenase/leucine dehydrogenase